MVVTSTPRGWMHRRVPLWPSTTNGSGRQAGLALVCVLLVAITSCGGSSSAGPAEGAAVTFSSSYRATLRAVTDLGLVPAASVCGSAIAYQGASGSWWQPVGAETAYNADGGTLVLLPTPLAAPDWPDRLSGIGAHNITIYPYNTPFNCAPPRTVPGTPPPGASRFVAADQLNVYAQIVFAGASATYNTALDAVTNLGLRLADPCYEQALARGAAPAWHATGQESGFAGAGILVVAPTFAAAANWQDRAHALISVTSLGAPFTAQCP
jgi:hypothetical protein